jgi:uncharacterized phiE125 gp8 family phage protein
LKGSYTLVTAPTTEPVTLDELKAQVRAEGSDEDAYLTSLIAAARQLVEVQTRRALITQTWRLTLDYFPGGTIDLTKVPVQSITSVVYDDTAGTAQTLSASDYVLDADAEPARLYPAYSLIWPTTRAMPKSVRVTFVAGYGAASAVPQWAKHAILLTAAHWWMNREPVSELPLREVPLSARALLGCGQWGSYP